MCEFYIVKQIIYLNDLLKTINHSFKIEKLHLRIETN